MCPTLHSEYLLRLFRRVRNHVQDNGAAGAALYFVFPRGTNPIKLEDESFELQIKFPSFQLKHRFRLKEMLFEGNLEF